MKNKKHVGKLFSALVLGGAMMAQADDSINIDDVLEEQKSICQVQIVTSDYQGKMGTLPVQTSTCVDDKSDEEILELVKEAKEESCLSPFCGCWLG